MQGTRDSEPPPTRRSPSFAVPLRRLSLPVSTVCSSMELSVTSVEEGVQKLERKVSRIHLTTHKQQQLEKKYIAMERDVKTSRDLWWCGGVCRWVRGGIGGRERGAVCACEIKNYSTPREV